MTTPDTSSQRGGAYDAGATSPPASPAPEPVSRWEDFIDILYAPAQVYARRATSGFWFPTLVVAAVMGVLYFATLGTLESIMDAEWNRSIARQAEKNPQLTPEAAAAMRSAGEVMGTVMAFLSIPLLVFFVGFTTWLVGKLFDAQQALRAALMVVAYAYVPRIIEAVLVAVQGLVMDTSTLDGRFRLTFGAARFLDPDTTPPLTLALLSRLDLFTIWVTVLIAIGLSVTGRISRQQAFIAAFIVWLLGALPGVIGAVMS